MAGKDTLNKFSTTAADNEDIGGIGVISASPISDGAGVFREMAKILADWVQGAYPIEDTASFADAADLTKIFRFDGGNVTAGQTRVISIPDRNMDLAKVGMEIIASGSVSNAASLALTDLSADYHSYQLVFDNLRPATDNVALIAVLSTDNGSNWETGASDYSHARQIARSDGTSTLSGNAASDNIALITAVGNNAAEVVSGTLDIIAPTFARRTKLLCNASYLDATPAYCVLQSSGTRTSTATHNAIRLSFTSGNITSMTYVLYGRRAS